MQKARDDEYLKRSCGAVPLARAEPQCRNGSDAIVAGLKTTFTPVVDQRQRIPIFHAGDGFHADGVKE
jgi:hypothetical protein